MKKDISVGLALSGGSAWGVAHVGALAALLKHGIEIDCISGTSAGSVVATLYAFGIPISEIEDAAKKLEWKQISRFSYSRLAFRTNASLAKLIRDLVGDADIKDAETPLAIVATDIEHGEEKIFREGIAADAVRASCAIPGYFAPVEIDGTLYVDGSISENLPLSPLQDMGAQFTIGVNLSSTLAPSRPRSIGDVITRSFEVLFRSRDKNVGAHVDVLVEPDLSSFQYRSFDEAEAIYAEGFRAAEAAIPLIKTKLALRRAEHSGFWRSVQRFFNA